MSTSLGYELRIDVLPYDVVVQILVHLSPPDLLSVALVNHTFYDAANSPILWRSKALSLLSQSRPLPLPSFPSVCLSKLPVSQLRKSILRSHYLFENWTSQNPLPVGPIKQSQISLSSPEAVVKIYRVGERWMICATECGSVVVWDLRGDGCEVARWELGHGWVVFNCRIDYEKGVVWCIAGQYPEAEDNMTVTLLQITFNTSSPTYTASTPDITFTPLHTFTLPSSHVLDLFILDHHAQLLCVLFCIRETNHIGMYTLCGWSDERKSGEQWSVIVDMGILHDHQEVNTTALSRDKKHIILYTETYEYEERVGYEVRALWELAYPEGIHGNGDIANGGMQISKAPEPMWRSRMNWMDSDGWQLRANPEGVVEPTIQPAVEAQAEDILFIDPGHHMNGLAGALSPVFAPTASLSHLSPPPSHPLLPSLSLPSELSPHPLSPPSFTPNSSTTLTTPMSALHARRQSRSPSTPAPLSLNLSPLIDNMYGIGGDDLDGFEVNEGLERGLGDLSIVGQPSFAPASAPVMESHSFEADDSASDLLSISMLFHRPTPLPLTSMSNVHPIIHSNENEASSSHSPYLSPRSPRKPLARLSIPVPQTAPLYTGFGFTSIDSNSYDHENVRTDVISRLHMHGHRRTDSTPTHMPSLSHLPLGRYSLSNRGRRTHGRTHGRTQSETLIGVVVPEIESPCLDYLDWTSLGSQNQVMAGSSMRHHSTYQGFDPHTVESDLHGSRPSGSNLEPEWDNLGPQPQPYMLPGPSTSSATLQELEAFFDFGSFTADTNADVVPNLVDTAVVEEDTIVNEVEDVEPLIDQDTHLIPISSYFLREWWPGWLPDTECKCTRSFEFEGESECGWRLGCGCERREKKDKTSHIMIYNAPGTGIWRVLQSFEESVDMQEVASKSSSLLQIPTDVPAHTPTRIRFAQTIKHPVLVPNEVDMFIQPLLDVDFSHAVWVEWVGVRVRIKDSDERNGLSLDWTGFGVGVGVGEGVDWLDGEDDSEIESEDEYLEEVPLEMVGSGVEGVVEGTTVKVQRRLRILTFPTHFDSTSSLPSSSFNSAPSLPLVADSKATANVHVRTLNIPQRILANTTRLVLDQSVGAVLLCAPAGEIWEVKYS